MFNEEENHDVFTQADEEVTTAPQEEEEVVTEEEQQPQGEENQEEEETPASEEDDTASKSEKMVPESRLKAALQDQENRLRNEFKQQTIQVPDQDADPEGFARHSRVEMSKTIMAEAVPDYNEKIQHFIQMAEVNPDLNRIVADAKNPAKFAYDLAKKDLELKEADEFRKSDDYKQFKEWQKNKGKEKPQTVAEKLVKVPNLNRKPSVTPEVTKHSTTEDDDGLFQGHYSLRN